MAMGALLKLKGVKISAQILKDTKIVVDVSVNSPLKPRNHFELYFSHRISHPIFLHNFKSSHVYLQILKPLRRSSHKSIAGTAADLIEKWKADILK